MKIVNLYVNLLNQLPVTVLIIFAALSVVIGDYAAKSWSVHQKPSLLLLAFAGYFFSGFFFIPTLLREGLIISSVLWVVISTAGFLMIGAIFFKEHLSPIQIIGVALGLMAILVLSIFE